MTKAMSRRNFLRMAGGAAGAALGVNLALRFSGRSPLPLAEIRAASAADPAPNLSFAGTDGWIYLPPAPQIISPEFGLVHPDPYAPSPFTTYIFGFRNVTNMHADATINAQMVTAQKNKAQHQAPLFWVNQYNPATNNEFRMQLTNLGLAQRPDLFDWHTIHWHGFRNVIPFFDGEPTGSVAVPQGQSFTYVFRPRDPGTYMYHCHVEDVEHVHMGMNGILYVRPAQYGNTAFYPSGKYVYNDGDGSTGYDREFCLHLSEVWADSHWADAHIQLPEWSDYRADFSLLNGRVYPDTLAPNGGSVDPFHPVRDANGDLIPPTGRPDLQYQPYSSLVTCNAGERVLLRFANLGFKEAAMTLTGIRMKVVGKDATPMRGRNGADTSYETETLSFGAGESIEAIFTAPPYQGPGQYDTYMLYNRRYTQTANLAGGYGGQTTEVRVYPPGALPAQTTPNT